MARRRDGGLHARAARLPGLRRHRLLREVVRAAGGAAGAGAADALAVVLVLTSVVSAGYYLYVVHGDVHAAAAGERAPRRRAPAA